MLYVRQTAQPAWHHKISKLFPNEQHLRRALLAENRKTHEFTSASGTHHLQHRHTTSISSHLISSHLFSFLPFLPLLHISPAPHRSHSLPASSCASSRTTSFPTLPHSPHPSHAYRPTATHKTCSITNFRAISG